MTDILAAIDIGSNAVRLLINYVEADGDGYAFKKAAYLRVPIRLGEDVFTRRRISETKAGCLLEAMRGFRHIMKAYAVSAFRACGTSAMRDADNGEALARSIRQEADITIEIVSGKQEAEFIYAAGALRDLASAASCLYVDVGGGSTELIVYVGQRMQFYDSFQIGTVRMLSNAVEKGEMERFSSSLRKVHELYTPKNIVASGGNINKAHKLLGKKNGDFIEPVELEKLYGNLNAFNFDARMQAFGLNAYRADVIVPALEIFRHITARCPSVRHIHVPKIGLADGLIRDLHKQRLQAVSA
jgi:exopolyphosphatase/guanosine-5'-triphosphate,3'-diphosphate pyrophosphatase